MISKNSIPALIDFSEGELILVSKPRGMTSFDVVRIVKKSFNIRKIGHAGTLDPLAEGLLILATGKMTKKLDYFQNMEKEYTGIMILGATTPCYDEEQPINETFDIRTVTEKDIYETVHSFNGEIIQLPPMFSAVKSGGRPAYLKARKGKEVILQPRKVRINRFEITAINLPEISFVVNCSKGTYIRSLVHDFGKMLNNGAYLHQLIRTKIGEYHLNDAIALDEMKSVVSKSEITGN